LARDRRGRERLLPRLEQRFDLLANLVEPLAGRRPLRRRQRAERAQLQRQLAAATQHANANLLDRGRARRRAAVGDRALANRVDRPLPVVAHLVSTKSKAPLVAAPRDRSMREALDVSFSGAPSRREPAPRTPSCRRTRCRRGSSDPLRRSPSTTPR